MSSTNLIPVTTKLPKNFIEALQRLRMAGYSDDQSLTQVSAIRQSILDAWSKTFPDVPFPESTEVK